MAWPLKIQGRLIDEAEVDEIRSLLKSNPQWNRSRLSRELCRRWHWQRPDGQMKDMACRELLRKLESRSLLTLPPRQNYGPRKRLPNIPAVNVDTSEIDGPLSDLQPIRIINVKECPDYEAPFNYLLKRWHYLSYARPVGQNMKYILLGNNGRYLGALLFGAAAWKTQARDEWIGWSVDERERNLGLICNNTRFLILDWVRVPHLASHVLGACLRRLSQDWQRRYGTEIALVETFVDTTRYAGTCYKAANWRVLGQTKGRSRQDQDRSLQVSIKAILAYPLRRDFRQRLRA